MKTIDLRKLSDAELAERLKQERRALIELRIQHATSPLDNPMKIREAKKSIARILTIMTENARKAN